MAAGAAIGHNAPVERDVSPAGKVIFEYEALVYQTFGSSMSVCTGTRRCHPGWLSRGSRSPPSEFSTHMFAVGGFGRSKIHRVRTGYSPPDGVGNYPVPVKINGRFVTGDASWKTFLVAYDDAVGDGNLACLGTPPRRPKSPVIQPVSQD